MKNEQLYREVFIGNTIRLVAEGGFEKATTRAIAHSRGNVGNVKMNEVHIYRVFGTKENLFAEVFKLLDSELIFVIRDNLSVFDSDKEFKEQCRELFHNIWRFLLSEETKCRYFTQYYYSPYFKGTIQTQHRQHYKVLIEKLSDGFKDDADVHSLLHHCITTMLDFAIRVYNGALEDKEENEYHIFNVVYSSIASYLK
jgi:AcrR family transcriptional regulator